MLNEWSPVILALAAGGVIGALYFGGLWWTVRKSLSSPTPARWIFGSLLVRTSVTLTGFYFIAGGHWEKLVACLVGFLIARQIVVRITQPVSPDKNLEREVSDAS